MLDWFWLGLAVKLAASASIVVAASLLVERSGPFIGAMVATLPISAGPAYVVLALEHSREFIAQSSLASLAVNAGTILYLTLYARLARRHGLIASLGSCMALWIGCAVVVTWLQLPVAGVVLLNAAAFLIGHFGLRGLERQAMARRPPPRWWDLPTRALAVMTIVIVVLVVGHFFGPKAAGIAALMPIVLTSLALILHPRIGGPATSVVFAHTLPGMIGFALALLVLHLCAAPLGSAAALSLGLATCLAWNGMLILWHRRAEYRQGKRAG